jgi:hypothetical protein
MRIKSHKMKLKEFDILLCSPVKIYCTLWLKPLQFKLLKKSTTTIFEMQTSHIKVPKDACDSEHVL